MNQGLRRQLWLKWTWKLLMWSIDDKISTFQFSDDYYKQLTADVKVWLLLVLLNLNLQQVYFTLSAVSRKMWNNYLILRTFDHLKWGPFNYKHMHSALNVDLSLFASDGWKVILKVLKREQKKRIFSSWFMHVSLRLIDGHIVFDKL